MKRLNVLAVAAALFLPLGLMGCAEKTEVEKKETVTTPTGSVEKTTTQEIEKTGDAKTNP